MTWRGLSIVFAARVVEHADISHAPFGFRSASTLLSHARGVETDVSAALPPRVALPGPGLARLVKGDLVVQQCCQPLSARFGDALDGRLAQSQSTQLLQRDFSRLRETGLQAGDAGHLAGGRRQMRGSQT